MSSSPSSARTASASPPCSRSLLGLLPVAAGQVRVLGQPPGRANHRDRLPAAAAQLRPSLRIRGIDMVRLGLDGDRWGIPLPFGSRAPRRRAARVAAVIELVGAGGYADRPIGECSGGEQQRLLIAQALIRRPAAAAARRAARQPGPAQPGGRRRADQPDLPRPGCDRGDGRPRREPDPGPPGPGRVHGRGRRRHRDARPRSSRARP